MVPKSDNAPRFCTDFRKVSALTKSNSFPLSRMEDCVDQVGHARFASNFELLKGYWQVPLSERVHEISAFITPHGLFSYNVMPFGLINASATFQRLMTKVLGDLEGCTMHLDNVVVFSDKWRPSITITASPSISQSVSLRGRRWHTWVGYSGRVVFVTSRFSRSVEHISLLCNFTDVIPVLFIIWCCWGIGYCTYGNVSISCGSGIGSSSRAGHDTSQNPKTQKIIECHVFLILSIPTVYSALLPHNVFLGNSHHCPLHLQAIYINCTSSWYPSMDTDCNSKHIHDRYFVCVCAGTCVCVVHLHGDVLSGC